MLARVMAVDFDALRARSLAVARACSSAADEAHVTCPRGTDLRARPDGPRGASPTTATCPRRGAFGNLPCGEGFIAPAGGDGMLVGVERSRRSGSPEPAC